MCSKNLSKIDAPTLVAGEKAVLLYQVLLRTQKKLEETQIRQ